MSGWTIPLDKFVGKAIDKLEVVARKTILEVDKGVIMDTPVDTGRARGNWQATIGTPASGVVEREDQIPVHVPGGHAFQECIDRASEWKPLTGISFILANNLPYIKPLNDGHSKQAPARFVEANVARVGGIAQDAASGAL